MNLKFARNLLSKHFDRVDTAESGAMALQKMKTNKYDVVLLDLEMPDMDGFQTAQAIRENEAKKQELLSRDADVVAMNPVNHSTVGATPVIIIAATTLEFVENSRSKYFSSGFNAHHEKRMTHIHMLHTHSSKEELKN